MSFYGRRTKWAILGGVGRAARDLRAAGAEAAGADERRGRPAVELGDRRGAPADRGALPRRRPEAGAARLPPPRRADRRGPAARSPPTRAARPRCRSWSGAVQPFASARARLAERRRRGHDPLALLEGDLPRPADDRGAARAPAAGRRPRAPRHRHARAPERLQLRDQGGGHDAAARDRPARAAAAARRLPLADPRAAAARRRRGRVLGRLRRDLPAREGGPARRQHVHVAAARADVRRRHRLLPAARRALPRQPPRRQERAPTPSGARSRRPRRR